MPETTVNVCEEATAGCRRTTLALLFFSPAVLGDLKIRQYTNRNNRFLFRSIRLLFIDFSRRFLPFFWRSFESIEKSRVYTFFFLYAMSFRFRAATAGNVSGYNTITICLYPKKIYRKVRSGLYVYSNTVFRSILSVIFRFSQYYFFFFFFKRLKKNCRKIT